MWMLLFAASPSEVRRAEKLKVAAVSGSIPANLAQPDLELVELAGVGIKCSVPFLGNYRFLLVL